MILGRVCPPPWIVLLYKTRCTHTRLFVFKISHLSIEFLPESCVAVLYTLGVHIISASITTISTTPEIRVHSVKGSAVLFTRLSIEITALMQGISIFLRHYDFWRSSHYISGQPHQTGCQYSHKHKRNSVHLTPPKMKILLN
jgi:hypothetical protein